MAKVVIEVPGWSSPGIEWRFSPITKKLQMCGYETKVFHNCDFGLADIYHNAHKLAGEVDQLTKQGDEVHIIGHSMGGLVALEASYSCDPTTVTTICSPLKGARAGRMAHRAPWTSARQMASDSDFIRNLIEPYVHTLNIGSKYDELVALESSVPNWSKNSMVLGLPHAHVTPLFSQKVANRIVEFIWHRGYNNN